MYKNKGVKGVTRVLSLDEHNPITLIKAVHF